MVDAQIELLSRLLQPIELDFHGERLRLQVGLLTAEDMNRCTHCRGSAVHRCANECRFGLALLEGQTVCFALCDLNRRSTACAYAPAAGRSSLL